ncbi:hypothetical protein GCM10007874_47110 [Labrys miyagiensis]|uniref:Uncharacterized protein n=1 Tax=Labrys miyagiensis TaxID=346912 RepID=A0ABQ6CPN0_9HYPH|nr:hypothetical protein [Labrys miyagiensis]GLS21694.1 hypothetical protein GCM10007874_47110 [Labrys miyagiensis]
MTSVEEFNQRLSATKDVLVGLQNSDLALVPLQEDELRLRARSLVSFLAGTDGDGMASPPWLADVAASAEDYLMHCLRSSMAAGSRAPMVSAPPRDPPINSKPQPWWRFWGR